MSVPRRLLFCGLALLLALPAAAQKHRDPLTDAEVDQLREVAQEPDARLKLWVKFVRARVAALDQARANPKASERVPRTHALLEDLANMADEMDDNVDTYARDKADIRKSLKDVIDVDAELQAKLKALKEAGDATTARDLPEYSFVLDNAIESVDASLDGARETLAQQVEQFKNKKDDEKKKKKQPAKMG